MAVSPVTLGKLEGAAHLLQERGLCQNNDHIISALPYLPIAGLAGWGRGGARSREVW